MRVAIEVHSIRFVLVGVGRQTAACAARPRVSVIAKHRATMITARIIDIRLARARIFLIGEIDVVLRP